MPVNRELVSVVIPTYNYGRYVGAAVESALAQTYPAVQVIVIDDGSTDDTRERLTAYGKRIRYVYQENQGLSAARNTGIHLAAGKFVALLDSDDLFHPRKIELQMKLFADRPKLGLVATGLFSNEPPQWTEVGETPVPALDLRLNDVIARSRFAPSSVLARRECFERVGAFDPTLRSVEDRDMWIRIAAKFGVAKIDLPLTWYRITPGSMSRNAERMEHFERLVLERALAMPELEKHRLFRRRARSLAAFAAAVMYRETGMYGRASSRALRSLLLWPVPHARRDLPMLTRLKFLCLVPRFLARGVAGAP